MRILSWNIKQLDAAWRHLAEDSSLDVALLQEAKPPPADFGGDVFPARDGNWKMHNYSRTFRTAIARRSDRVQLKARSPEARRFPTPPCGTSETGSRFAPEADGRPQGQTSFIKLEPHVAAQSAVRAAIPKFAIWE